MLRLKDVPPAEMPEVIRLAGELQSREQDALAQDQARQHIVNAAGELGLPEEYLERAAAEWHQRKVRNVGARQDRRQTLALALAVGGAIVVGGMGLLTFSQPPAKVAPPRVAPIIETFEAGADSRWVLDKNPETEATVSFPTQATEETAAVITVQRFGQGAGRTPFFTNLDMVTNPPPLKGYQTVSFRVRGDGLSRVRVDLQNGPNERWRSSALPVTGDWQQQQIRLDQLERQTRSSTSAEWKVAPFQPPDAVQRLSFKVGYFINDASAKGTIALDDLKVE